jgi:hypothetical protein
LIEAEALVREPVLERSTTDRKKSTKSRRAFMPGGFCISWQR